MKMLSIVLVPLVLVLSGVSELMTGQTANGETIIERLNDDEITEDVRGKLAADNYQNMNMLAFDHVDVHTERGVVILSGVVPTSEHKARAEQLAGQVNGVIRISNNLQVRNAKQQ